jgi:hypothetical protein
MVRLSRDFGKREKFAAVRGGKWAVTSPVIVDCFVACANAWRLSQAVTKKQR